MTQRQDVNLPFVSLMLITYRQPAMAEATVRGLFKQDYPRHLFEIVALDDGSGDSTVERLHQLASDSPVRMIVLAGIHEDDYLTGTLYNRCIAAANSHSEVLIQIEDALVRRDFVRQHVKWHVGVEQFLVTGAMFEADAETWSLHTCRRSCLTNSEGAPVICDFQAIWGKSLSYRRSLVEAVWNEPHDRPYDERMQGWGYHDTEFALRSVLCGATPIYDPGAGVFHPLHSVVSDSARDIDRSAHKRVGESRNPSYICEKHRLPGLPSWADAQPIACPPPIS
jgi:glycosyltransferase involved in cell wall biosynthesis